jgi:predicted homoserine dehydrogenase-like protein
VIIVDGALRERAERGDPVRVALVGAGFMGRGIANQIVNSTPGMELAVIANRRPERAVEAYELAGLTGVEIVDDLDELERRISSGRPTVVEDAHLVCRAEAIDAAIEVTGSVEFGAGVVLDAIEHGKHVILLNAELDGTLGPVLKVHADRAGVVYSASEGDQPGVQMNLIRFVRGIGLTPLVSGNVKGLHDPYRNPTTQEGFARQWGQNPHMVTSFADGTKISFEQATVANATGMTVARRGMYGFEHDGHVDELTTRYDLEELVELGGIVDYVVGAQPSPGVFVLATHDDSKQRHYLNLYKLGEGPLYSFYIPYHLCHFEVPTSVARAVLFGDAVMAPAGPPEVEVVAAAKVDLASGETIDAMGGYKAYGLAEDASVVATERLLPVGVAEGCTLVRDVLRDQVLTYDDVKVPRRRLQDRLREEQAALFGHGLALAGNDLLPDVLRYLVAA